MALRRVPLGEDGEMERRVIKAGKLELGIEPGALAIIGSQRRIVAALELGAHQVFESGARLPERVDAVMETVGAATWEHSVASVREEGTIVISGATSGPNPRAALTRIFFHQLRVVGSTMGTRDELAALLRFCETAGVRPVIDSVLPLREGAAEGFAKMEAGELMGKIVFTL